MFLILGINVFFTSMIILVCYDVLIPLPIGSTYMMSWMTVDLAILC